MNELDYPSKIKEIQKKLSHRDCINFANKALEKAKVANEFFRYHCWGLVVILIVTYVMFFQSSYISSLFLLVYIMTNIVTIYLGIKSKRCTSEFYNYIDKVFDDNKKIGND